MFTESKEKEKLGKGRGICCDQTTEQEPSRQKANRSAYAIYYGKQGISSTTFILSNENINVAKNEYALLSLHELMEMVGKKNHMLKECKI
jgi:hypothetical protein